MKKILPILIFISCNIRIAYTQQNTASCKVLLSALSDSYKGECKNGLAHGQGEAIGRQRYNGVFKYGMPNGYGTYYYNDSTYHSGYFQDGKKEGKGESHYLHAGLPDSVIKGFWSGNIFRGKKYVTYHFDGGTKLDRYEIIATPETGRTVTFEMSTTSGSPTGVPSDLFGNPGYVLRLVDLNAADNTVIRLITGADNPTKAYLTYDLGSFPVILYGTLSNGDSFKLELYKPARWTVRFFINR